MPKRIYQVKGVATYAGSGRICLDESINVLADDAEQAIKRVRQYLLKQTWKDRPDSGKDKGKCIVMKCTRFELESVEKIASAEI